MVIITKNYRKFELFLIYQDFQKISDFDDLNVFQSCWKIVGNPNTLLVIIVRSNYRKLNNIAFLFPLTPATMTILLGLIPNILNQKEFYTSIFLLFSFINIYVNQYMLSHSKYILRECHGLCWTNVNRNWYLKNTIFKYILIHF